MKRAVLVCALLALTACQWDPPHQGARNGNVPALDPSGYGPLHIGMSLDDARAATQQALTSNALGNEDGCAQEPFYTADGDTLYAMFENKRLVRISANSQAMHTKTAQNVGVGSTDAQVRTAYSHVVQQPAKYHDLPAHDLVVWTDPNRSGFRFEIDGDGNVSSIHAGTAAIMYVEGCA